MALKPRPDSIFYRKLQSCDEIEIHPIGEEANECMVSFSDVGNGISEIIMTLDEAKDLVEALHNSIT